MKKITRWIELIFIFGIPLLLLILCMQFKTINTYDENNNIITSEKILDIKELDFISTQEKTYKSISYINNEKIINDIINENYYKVALNQYIFNKYLFNLSYMYTEDLDYEEYFYIDDDMPLIWFDLKRKVNNNIYNVANFELRIGMSDKNDNLGDENWEELIKQNKNFKLYIYDENYTWNIEYGINETYWLDNNGKIIINIEKLINEIKAKTGERLEELFIDNVIITNLYSNNTMESDCLFTNTEIETKTINENAISKVLNIMYDSLGINNNIIIQLIIIYTLLWIIMFIIWHIFYLPFNKLLHMFDKE